MQYEKEAFELIRKVTQKVQNMTNSQDFKETESAVFFGDSVEILSFSNLTLLDARAQ